MCQGLCQRWRAPNGPSSKSFPRGLIQTLIYPFEGAGLVLLLAAAGINVSIAAGALSGHLGTSLDQVVKVESRELEIALEKFNRVFQRLVAFTVAMSLVDAILACVLAAR